MKTEKEVEELEYELINLSNALGAVNLALAGQPIPKMTDYDETAYAVEKVVKELSRLKEEIIALKRRNQIK